jgi:hypothetical protein
MFAFKDIFTHTRGKITRQKGIHSRYSHVGLLRVLNIYMCRNCRICQRQLLRYAYEICSY